MPPTVNPNSCCSVPEETCCGDDVPENLVASLEHLSGEACGCLDGLKIPLIWDDDNGFWAGGIVTPCLQDGIGPPAELVFEFECIGSPFDGCDSFELRVFGDCGAGSAAQLQEGCSCCPPKWEYIFMDGDWDSRCCEESSNAGPYSVKVTIQ